MRCPIAWRLFISASKSNSRTVEAAELLFETDWLATARFSVSADCVVAWSCLVEQMSSKSSPHKSGFGLTRSQPGVLQPENRLCPEIILCIFFGPWPVPLMCGFRRQQVFSHVQGGDNWIKVLMWSPGTCRYLIEEQPCSFSSISLSKY